MIISKIISGPNFYFMVQNCYQSALKLVSSDPTAGRLGQKQTKQREPSDNHMDHSAYRSKNKPGNTLHGAVSILLGLAPYYITAKTQAWGPPKPKQLPSPPEHLD